MTKTERKAVAKPLREWAAWCEANPDMYWDAWTFPVEVGAYMYAAAWDAAYPWCEDRGKFFDKPQFHYGPTAAIGLLLAAAMIEAADEA